MFTGENPSQLASKLTDRPVTIILVSWFVGSIVLGLLGPFGTFNILSLPTSLIFWFSVTALGLTILVPLNIVTKRIFGSGRHRFFYDVVQTPVFTLIYLEPLQRLIIWYAKGEEVFGRVHTTMAIVAATLFLILIREIAIALRRPSAHAHNNQPNEPLQQAAPCPLTARLPDNTDPVIWSVSSDNHHIIVRGPTSQSVVLMRFSDALLALSTRQGVQVHRSHWVADEAIGSWMVDGHRLAIQLHDGHMIPVSKTFAETVQRRWPNKERVQAVI